MGKTGKQIVVSALYPSTHLLTHIRNYSFQWLQNSSVEQPGPALLASWDNALNGLTNLPSKVYYGIS